MKRRWAWVWVLTYTETDTKWYGTCPKWAGQPVPEGATLTKHRMQIVGTKREQCHVPGCTESHYLLPMPEVTKAPSEPDTEPVTEGVAA